MPGYFNYFIDNTGQFLVIAATAVVWLGITAVGSLITGKNRIWEGSFLFGWASLVLVFTIAGVLPKRRLHGWPRPLRLSRFSPWSSYGAVMDG